MSGKRDDDWIVAQTLTGGDAQVDQTVRTRVPDPGSDPLQSLDTLVGDDEDEDDGFDLIGRADVASEAPHETTQEITGSAVLEVSSHDPAWVSEPDPGDEDEHEGTPWVASDEPPSADEAAPALRSRLTQELVDNAEGTPFAVATDEILLEDLLDSEPFDDAFIDAPLDDAPIDSPRTHHFSIEAHELEADDFDETAYWRDRIAAIREEQTRLRNTRREPDLLGELGRIYEQRFNDPDEAIAIYERLREMSADDEEAFMALDRLYQGAQEIDKLIELLLDRQDQIDERDEKAEVLARVAELYVKVRRRDEAEVVLDAAVALAPSHERVQGVLKMLAQSDPEDAGSSLFPASAPSSPPPAAPPPQDPVEELETRLAAAGEVSDRVSILDSLATLYRRRNRPSEAARCLNEIISLDRRRDSAYRQLAEIYRQHQRHSDLARVLELYARAIAPQARVEILRQLAALYEGPLGDVASAVASYERLHAILPDDAPTIWALIRYHEERGDAHSLLEILRDASQRLRGSERVEIFYRQGKIMAEALGDSAGAEEHYQRALENDPSHAPSIAELTEIYRARRDWGKAVRMMLAAEAASSAPAQKARYLCEAGVTSLEHLGDERRAQEMLARTLEIDPDHEEAAEALAGLLFRRQEFDGLVPVLDVLLRKTRREDQSRFIDLNHKLGVVSVALGDRERGERAFRKVLELEPHHAEALIGLGDLAFEAGDYRQAQAAYRQIGDTLNTLEPS
ncbi:MAG: tetratricopeptide repeat protein, partial [Deltaproteobacteria bacterium]|nr:tetratricopeptide repeat protein [Deltaproteobacteria bacterium]